MENYTKLKHSYFPIPKIVCTHNLQGHSYTRVIPIISTWNKIRKKINYHCINQETFWTNHTPVDITHPLFSFWCVVEKLWLIMWLGLNLCIECNLLSVLWWYILERVRTFPTNFLNDWAMTDLTLTLQEKEIYYSLLHKLGILLDLSY